MSDKPRNLPCLACQEAGKDTAGDNLRVFPSGKFHCIAAGKDKLHNRRIIELMPELGNKEARPLPCVPRPIPEPSRLDLLARIKSYFPASLYDLWDRSPVRADEDLDEVKAFLRLFPADALLWIAPDVRKSGYPEATLFFRTRAEWEAEKITEPGTRIAPSWFRHGTISRSKDTVLQHLFVVIESDEIGEGKLYASKDDFCSLIRWLREACAWQLAAVVDSGNKSLHAWFRHPGSLEIKQLAEHAAVLGLDGKFSEPSQPWRLPGVARENTSTRQQLVYLDLEAAL